MYKGELSPDASYCISSLAIHCFTTGDDKVLVISVTVTVVVAQAKLADINENTEK
jgi:D-lyxose ketol-isomerase